MTDKIAFKNPVESITKSLKTKDSELLANAIKSLILKYPKNWEEYLLHSGFLSSPMNDTKKSDLILIAESLRKLTDIDDIDVLKKILYFIRMSLSVNELFRIIKEEKENIIFFKESPATKIFVLAYFLESQLRAASKYTQTQIDTNSFFSDSTMSVATAPLAHSPGKVAIQEGMEATCENSELILREILHKVRSANYGKINSSIKAYNSIDFEKAFHLGAYWKKVEELWSNIRFANWEVHFDEDKLIFLPKEKDYIVREAVSTARHLRILYSITSINLPYINSIASDTAKSIEKLSRSLSKKDKNNLWDGIINRPLLREISKHSFTKLLTEIIIKERHYEQLLPKKISQGGFETSWNSWFKTNSTLRVLAAALQIKADKNPVDNPERLIFRTKKSVLIEILSFSTEIDQQEMQTIISLLTFDPKRKRMEIWDQPLLPTSKEELLILPRLTQMGSNVRAIENMALEFGTADFGTRGGSFEKHIASIWKQVESALVVEGLRIQLGDEELEFDIIVYWDGKLILCEAKCLKSVHSSADEKRAWEQVDYSVTQLKRRKKAVSTYWSDFRQKAYQLKLPEKTLFETDIFCVAINNLTQFTGMKINDISILDDVVLSRFFQNPEVRASYTGQESSVKVMDIRDELTANNFIKYTKELPQVAEVKSRVKTSLTHLLPLREGSPLVLYPIAELAPSIMESEAVQQLPSKKIAESPKQQKWPHKVGRNNPCPCGSGKKYKRCCINSKV